MYKKYLTVDFGQKYPKPKLAHRNLTAVFVCFAMYVKPPQTNKLTMKCF